MKKRLLMVITALLSLCIVCSGCAGAAVSSPEDANGSQDVLYQVSTLDALMQGVYDGETTLDELLAHGDFGIGTFEGLDGEMVVLDKTVYQVLASGEVVEAEGSVKTPFAMVTNFDADIQSKITDKDYTQLQDEINALLPSQNKFYAINIEGTFTYVKTRSVPAQTEPYPTLAEVTSEQRVFEFNNVKGTLVGYWCPEYISGVNLAGYHLHFLSEDHTMGGHLLECSIEEADVSIDTTDDFYMLLPENDHFAGADLSGVTTEGKQSVEQ
ncbi:MAG: acetolactate decarboxylase [Acetanaerobacterium sp.]